VTAVNNANTGVGDSGQALLEGFHPAIVVSLIAALAGVLAMTIPGRRRAVETARVEETELAPEYELDAA
jgi:hypothetical protein